MDITYVVSTPSCHGLDIEYNKTQILNEIKRAKIEKASLIVFPIDALVGIEIGNLVNLQDIYLKQIEALDDIKKTAEGITVVLGIYKVVKGKSKHYAYIIDNGKAKDYLIDNVSAKASFKNGLSFTISNDINLISEEEYTDLKIILHKGNYNILDYGNYVKTIQETNDKYKGILLVSTPSFECTSSDIISITQNCICINGQVYSISKILDNDYINSNIRKGNFNSIPNEEDSNFVKNPFENICEPCLDLIFEMQARGLVRRFKASFSKKMVIGVSGGLDSTLALLVASRACDILGISRDNVLSITMPCFGTTNRTKNNAERLSKLLGVDFSEIDIKSSVLAHFEAIGHKENVYDTAYENAQARERVQVLFDIANMVGGIVVGTGDLSELALGWTTYSGDHMCNYSVNGSIPKTLMRSIIKNIASLYADLKDCLFDILDTPVSPELLPAKDGKIAQKTELLLGSYDVYDCILYYGIYKEFTIKELYKILQKVFLDQFDKDEIKIYLRKFYSRFLSQQFKRSCLPDGIQAALFSLSPRDKFYFPSDMSSNAFMDIIDSLN